MTKRSEPISESEMDRLEEAADRLFEDKLAPISEEFAEAAEAMFADDDEEDAGAYARGGPYDLRARQRRLEEARERAEEGGDEFDPENEPERMFR